LGEGAERAAVFEEEPVTGKKLSVIMYKYAAFDIKPTYNH